MGSGQGPVSGLLGASVALGFSPASALVCSAAAPPSGQCHCGRSLADTRRVGADHSGSGVLGGDAVGADTGVACGCSRRSALVSTCMGGRGVPPPSAHWAPLGGDGTRWPERSWKDRKPSALHRATSVRASPDASRRGNEEVEAEAPESDEGARVSCCCSSFGAESLCLAALLPCDTGAPKSSVATVCAPRGSGRKDQPGPPSGGSVPKDRQRVTARWVRAPPLKAR